MSCPHIDAETYRVYSTLASFGGMPEIRPTVSTISKKSCVSVRKVNYAIKKLLEIGFVEIKIGGGRGRSNVYNLLKAVKGCTICSVSKPCTDEQETLHETTLNPAHGAHHKDIYKNNKKDTAPSAGTMGNEVIYLFRGLNPSYEELYKRKPQHIAAENLIALHGFEKIMKVIEFVDSRRSDQFCPTITTPSQLEQKWAALEKYALGLKGNIRSKQRIWV